MKLWEHTGDELLSLPMPDLALLVLADFQARNGWNVYNWINENQQWHTEVMRVPGVADRLSEAWAWLEARAFVSRRFDQSTPDSRRVTEEGGRALELGLDRLHGAARLEVELSPRLEKAKRQFLQGDYEEAVFAAFRAVEEDVRTASDSKRSDLGVRLMRQAFLPTGGPLADPESEPGEQEALMHLFSGAIGVFKNPSSHRTVEYEDPALASEAVLLADLLLRLLERRKQGTEAVRRHDAPPNEVNGPSR